MKKSIFKTMFACLLTMGLILVFGGGTALAEGNGTEAFAVYSETDNSLTFYTDDTVPEAGSEYEGKAVTNVYGDLDSLVVSSYRSAPWINIRANEPDVVIDSSFSNARPISLKYWFYGFSGDSFVGFENLNTSAVTDMSYMFAECYNLTSVNVSEWDTSSVTDMGYMFSDCYNLLYVDVGEWNTTNVMYMDAMFNYCMSLETLDVSKWNTENVEMMGYMFYGCESLTSIDLSKWNVSSVTWMSYMFNDCISLESLDLSSWNTSNLTQMTNMFEFCEGLTTLDMSGWDTSHVTTMAYLFFDCCNLTDLNVSGWDTSCVTDMYDAFAYCENLESVDVSGWDTSNVKSMADLFMDCASLTSVDVSAWDTSRVTDMQYVFAYCENLESVDVSGWDVSNVTEMWAMFALCENLESVDVSGWDVSNVTGMESLFDSCESLISLDLSGWDTENVQIMDDFAVGCTALEWVKIGENTDIFTKGQAVDQQIWYDSPTNGNVVSDDYLQDVTTPGQYWTYTSEVVPTVSEVKITASEGTKTYDGSGITLTVITAVTPDTAEISYQWYKVEDGTETLIEGATSSQYTTGGDISDSGTYKCVVTAACDPYTAEGSAEITITIEEAAVDKTGLETLVDDAKEKEQDKYTTDSWAVFTKALADAEEVLNDPDATQDEVNEAREALQTAMDNLEKVTDPGIGTGNTGDTGDVEETGTVKTADTNPTVWYLFLLAVSGTVILVIYIRRRILRK